MNAYIFFFGKTPFISLAEVEAVLETTFTQKWKGSALFKTDKNAEEIIQIQEKLGGTVKIAKVLGGFKEEQIEETILQVLIDRNLEEKKWTLGLNIYEDSQQAIRPMLKTIKKSYPYSLRFCNHDFQNLASVVTLKQIIQKGKTEINIIKDKKHQNFLLSETISCQNIDSYSFRDYNKPHRDAKNGMLPPKLAQTLINLAGNEVQTIWDPFCGSGTLLMEVLLMNKKAIGSDLNPKMIPASLGNIEWLQHKFPNASQEAADVFFHDATHAKLVNADAVVTEGFLGEPKRKAPNEIERQKTDDILANLYSYFFKNLQKTRIKTVVLCLPVYQMDDKNLGFMEKTLAAIKQNGYTPSALSSFDRPSLLYKRENQFVLREIWKFTKS